MDATPPRIEDPAEAWRRGHRRGAAALVVALGLIWAAAAILLVADDVATNRTLIRAYLVGAGHWVALAEDGIEAVAVAQGRRFDAILMDVNMPGLDGTEAAQRLRPGKGPNARTPIIALTASTSREERERVQQSGMTLHLAKPVSRVTLLQALQRVAALAASG